MNTDLIIYAIYKDTDYEGPYDVHLFTNEQIARHFARSHSGDWTTHHPWYLIKAAEGTEIDFSDGIRLT